MKDLGDVSIYSLLKCKGMEEYHPVPKLNPFRVAQQLNVPTGRASKCI
jgi:hypothetical protein